MQKIYSYAKDFGFDNLIKHDQGRDSYSETLEFEEGDVREFLNDFEENNFGESLISNLAERDFHKEIGPDGLRKLSLDENFEIIGKHEEKWADEFSKHGLENLKI